MYIEEYYYKINRILLMIIGLWPYQNSTLATVQNLLISSILGSSIYIQLIPFITHECNSILVIDVLSYMFPTLVAVIKYYYFYMKAGVMKRLLEQVQADWNSLKDKHEREIIKSYAEIGRLITIFATMLCYSVPLVYAMSTMVPYIINIYLSHNNTYVHYVYIPIDYSVNQEKYIYVKLLHFFAFLCIALNTVVAFAALIGLYFKHACGLLKIASYRIEHAMNVEDMRPISPLEREYVMCIKIMRAVSIQQKALKFTDRIMSCFTIMYFLLIIIGAISISVSMFRLVRILQTNSDWREAFIMAMSVIGHFVYMFIANYAAQEISDHCNDVFFAAYSSTWYVAPLRIQKLILFLLQRGAKNFTIILGGIFIGSLEGFASILSASLSYFMVICSTQLTEEKMAK
ncbi:odorant receptor 24a-like [Linepithema humile]|uniref:odorant receptor 24a-like n=1 Tax=Linepithema humile TaxID=83485 RepID=UPI00351F0F8C